MSHIVDDGFEGNSFFYLRRIGFFGGVGRAPFCAGHLETLVLLLRAFVFQRFAVYGNELAIRRRFEGDPVVMHGVENFAAGLAIVKLFAIDVVSLGGFLLTVGGEGMVENAGRFRCGLLETIGSDGEYGDEKRGHVFEYE